MGRNPTEITTFVLNVHTMEYFVNVKNFNQYEVSNLGRIRRNGKILKPVLKNGYHSVGLSKGGVVSVKYIHRLVCESFLENPENRPQVNHKDFDRTNNVLSNLEWCTPKENNVHASTKNGRKYIGLKGALNPNYNNRGSINPNSKAVKCITNGVIYGSRKEAARELGLNAGNITNICNGKRKTINGLTFQWM